MNKSQNQKSKARMRDFLLSFFDNEIKWDKKEVNGYILTKNVSGDSGTVYVQIFTKESWNKRAFTKRSPTGRPPDQGNGTPKTDGGAGTQSQDVGKNPSLF